MSALLIDSYNRSTQNYSHQKTVKKSASNNKSQAPSDSQNHSEPALQPAHINNRQSALMETFEKMRRISHKSKDGTVTDPFGLIRKAEGETYASLADEKGIIEYNGVRFTTNEKEICLGDVSSPDQVICIALSTGEELQVNRNSIGELSRAIGMFSPEDQNRILRALQIDAKIQEVKAEITGMGDDVGKGNSRKKTDGTQNAQKMNSAAEMKAAGSADDTKTADVQGSENAKKEQETGAEKDIQEKTETEIIVKPDGSRVLVTTVHIGGTETVMSMEISKPNDAKDKNL